MSRETGEDRDPTSPLYQRAARPAEAAQATTDACTQTRRASVTRELLDDLNSIGAPESDRKPLAVLLTASDVLANRRPTEAQMGAAAKFSAFATSAPRGGIRNLEVVII